ncbi:2OG-Fe(II) oxygenase [Rhodobacter sp. HX-7-19]|uniref:2OG-Fe(II) oxygenase n=1 Tax=Paragemmobacter kunshanensis TaxID=2583234 RepID=A0A6M1U0H7_9RHOB|nr:2OG-Fe(II) oxygenase [Rhodobacter kunshanensis]NGQ90924.1 2OG-Fe(II) oxygenase [Rhodobacter kunshanensis]
MTRPVLPIDPETLLISTDAAREAARPHAEAYRAAQPYPHGGFDDFLPPEILERVLVELRDLPEAETSFDRAQERLKTSYTPERLGTYTKNLFYALNSKPFILFLEELTGITGLIPDPYFSGGGIHRIETGGHLDIHADFNHHAKMNLERRLNVLIYLNHDWKAEYGGSFELWDKEMKGMVSSFVPSFNRMVCFSTTSDSWHGNPSKVNHPEGQPRQSIALYYYTATWDATRKGHTTLFKPRPGTADQKDKRTARIELMQDLLPPIVYRKVAGLMYRLGI